MEQTRHSNERRGGAPGAGLDDAPSLATVSHGPYAEQLPVAGFTVGQVRDRFRDRLDIDPESRPYVDGTPAGDDTVIRAGQLVMFARRAGEKGRWRE